MKKILLTIITLILLVGCSKGDEFTVDEKFLVSGKLNGHAVSTICYVYNDGDYVDFEASETKLGSPIAISSDGKKEFALDRGFYEPNNGYAELNVDPGIYIIMAQCIEDFWNTKIIRSTLTKGKVTVVNVDFSN